MSYPLSSQSRADSGASWTGEPREPGARRKKLAGYLKAANELRQSYQQSYTSGWASDRDAQLEADDDGMPGAFPDATVVRSGHEEMVLFPSYTRRHVKSKPAAEPGTIQEAAGTGRDVRDAAGAGDAEFWQQQWEQYEDDNAVVDVDIRGWLYSPHRGPMNRKQRLFVGLARQLVGISAPPAAGSDVTIPRRDDSPRSLRERAHATAARQEEEAVSKEAESIMKKGEVEAHIAERGGYSEVPKDDASSIRSYSSRSEASSPSADSRPATPASRFRSMRGEQADPEDDSRITPVQKRASWNQPANMSPEELTTANKHLLARLKPFLANPLPSTPISAFFYNDEMSKSRVIRTNAYGHFSLRAALDFVPTHVRILASESLSATEAVCITESKGVSLISDIDDTLKHSAISAGAREIFRNAFIRELKDLTIDGVNDWYRRLADKDVKFHYVSNSPWQLYPVIRGFFSLAGLPDGSFHLKQYSGMLQGIFEPVAERKKSTLDKIARDFSERKFILVGDSGEADLEVYCDFVRDNPGRVLGVYIRDVTTPETQGFFDSSTGPWDSEKSGAGGADNGITGNNSQLARPVQGARAEVEEDDPHLRAAIEASLRDMEPRNRRYAAVSDGAVESRRARPHLPPRPPSDPLALRSGGSQPATGRLIDVDSPASSPSSTSSPLVRVATDPITNSPRKNRSNSSASTKSVPPAPPRKPIALRGTVASHGQRPPAQQRGATPPQPPPPRQTIPASQAQYRPALTSNRTADVPRMPPPVPPPFTRPSYATSARQKLSAAYNALPAAPSLWAQQEQQQSQSAFPNPGARPPPPPPRRTVASFSTAASRQAENNRATDALGSNGAARRQDAGSGGWANSEDPFAANGNGGTVSDNQGIVNKKEEMWRRRWASAKEFLETKGVMLRSWRVGSDVANESVRIVEEELRKQSTQQPQQREG